MPLGLESFLRGMLGGDVSAAQCQISGLRVSLQLDVSVMQQCLRNERGPTEGACVNASASPLWVLCTWQTQGMCRTAAVDDRYLEAPRGGSKGSRLASRFG